MQRQSTYSPFSALTSRGLLPYKRHSNDRSLRNVINFVYLYSSLNDTTYAALPAVPLSLSIWKFFDHQSALDLVTRSCCRFLINGTAGGRSAFLLLGVFSGILCMVGRLLDDVKAA